MIGREDIIAIARELEQEGDPKASIEQMDVDADALLEIGGIAAIATMNAALSKDPLVCLTALYMAGFAIGMRVAKLQETVEA